jgi:GWxTD domain-containing protein
MVVRGIPVRPGSRSIALAVLLLVAIPRPSGAQSLPGPVYYELYDRGAGEVAERLDRRLEPRSDPDRSDVEDLLHRWERATGGPSGDWEWLAVARLWVRAGDADRASDALDRVGDGVPEPFHLLERSRIGFLEGRSEAAAAWWAACAIATEESSLEAWLDLVSLATPEEREDWDRFRRLPAGQRDDCAFFRRFLNRRAIASGQVPDERLAQHYERLRFAREHYRRRGKETGTEGMRQGLPRSPAFDDRGTLYVRMGEPDRTAGFQAGECYEPNVTWAYEDPDGIRLYHLSPLGGTDDWWLLDNLARVFRCPVDPATGAIIRTRNPMVALSPVLPLIPPWLLADLYTSRSVLDPEYSRMASRFSRNRTIEQLQIERDMTGEDARLAIRGIPERPNVDTGVQFDREWIQFRSPRPGTTRVWINVEASGDDLREALERSGTRRVEAVLTLLDETEDRLVAVPAAFDLDLPPRGSRDEVMGLRVPAEVPPGDYSVLFQLKVPGESSGRAAGNYVRDTLIVRDFGGTLPLLSDVAVAPDSGGAWQPHPGLAIRPSPSHRSGPDGIAWIYLEAYNLTPGGNFAARVRLREQADADRAPAFEQEYAGTAVTGARIVTPIILRLELDDVPAGTYALSVGLTDLATGTRTLDSKTTVEVYRPG